MSPKGRNQRKPRDVHTHLTIAIDETEVCTETSLNHAVHNPQLTWLCCEEDPLIDSNTYIDIRGVCVAPNKRAGDLYRITLFGDRSPSRAPSATLRDVQAEDEYGAPQYRNYRGQKIPIFKPPKGLTVLEKIRGKSEWSAWLRVAPHWVTDVLVLSGQGRRLYAEIHEMKVDRKRWIQSIRVQTMDPEAE